jgi:hypothetical protein
MTVSSDHKFWTSISRCSSAGTALKFNCQPWLPKRAETFVAVHAHGEAALSGTICSGDSMRGLTLEVS